MKKNLIIDTDPGCDDGVAIIIALKNLDKLNLKLISTVGGNIAVETCAKNALYIVENFSTKNIPVAIGEETNKEINASDVHGEGGLGNVKVGTLKTSPLSNGIEEMYKALKASTEKTIIAELGPATNIAKLLEKHPECKDKIDYIFMMGGSMDGTGNITPYAEFNAYSNPEALEYIAESGINIVFSPMQIGNQCAVKKSLIIDRKISNSQEQIIHDIVAGAFEPGRPGEFCIFDAQVIMGLLHPELYDFVNCELTVNTTTPLRGQTYMKETDKTTLFKVQLPKDCEKIKKVLLEELYK